MIDPTDDGQVASLQFNSVIGQAGACPRMGKTPASLNLNLINYQFNTSIGNAPREGALSEGVSFRAAPLSVKDFEL